MSEFYAEEMNNFAHSTEPDVRGPSDPMEKAICYLNADNGIDHTWSAPIYPIHSGIKPITLTTPNIRRVCIMCGAAQYKDSLPTSPHYGKWCYYEHKYANAGCVDYPGSCGAY